MNEPTITSVEITGEFVFEPVDILGLTSMISKSALANKADLLQALWWPRSDWEHHEDSDLAADDHVEKMKRNMLRSVGRHIGEGLQDDSAKRLVRFNYIAFKHGKSFYEEQGYREAGELIVARKYSSSRLIHFMSFILQMSEELRKIGLMLAAPTYDPSGRSSLYPHYCDNVLWFSDNAGDIWSDNELPELIYSLLFGAQEIYGGD